MNPVIETLSYPLMQGLISAGRSAFLNAQTGLKALRPSTCQQYFKVFADQLAAEGTESSPDFPDGEFEIVLLLLPKNRLEAEYLLAKGLEMLQPGGWLIAAGDNKAGGARLNKTFKEFGLEAGSYSKNRARVAWGKKAGSKKVKEALAAGEMQKNEFGFFSQAGIFGWDKIDKGSEILSKHLPELSGAGADFGCGYGYLSQHALQNGKNIGRLYCIDADARALEASKANLTNFENTEFIWADLTKAPDLKNLDWVVMNPPFHEGKATDTGIGHDFIRSAAKVLKKGGALWMVANSMLPYEKILDEEFFSVKKISEGGGFKVFCAVK
jgi:16S rRNA (guanine1207-N2)-methyltransferase